MNEEELEKQLAALQAERDDLKAALVEARGNTYPQPRKGWQCFHCGEWFTTEASAKSHFGESPESFTELSNLLEDHRQQYADKCLEVIGLQAENDKLRKVVDAANNLLSYMHEDGMEGETSYELAVLELERALAEDLTK